MMNWAMYKRSGSRKRINADTTATGAGGSPSPNSESLSPPETPVNNFATPGTGRHPLLASLSHTFTGGREDDGTCENNENDSPPPRPLGRQLQKIARAAVPNKIMLKFGHLGEQIKESWSDMMWSLGHWA